VTRVGIARSVGGWRRVPWHMRYRVGAAWASQARKALILATHQHCTVEFQGPVRLGPGFTLDIPDAGSFLVGPGVDFRVGFKCEISGNGRVSIGAGSTFTFQRTDPVHQPQSTLASVAAITQSCLIVDGFHRVSRPHPPRAGPRL